MPGIKRGNPAGIAASIFAIAIMLAAACRSVLVAWADLDFQRGTPEAVHAAEALMPSNARYHYTSALLKEQDEPLSPTIEHEFSIAATNNPRYTDALLAWGVERELSGDKAGAQKLLIDAQAIDHQLRPVWALANFYFRQGDDVRFWPEAHECLRLIGKTGLSEGRFDPVPVYQLCWKMDASADTILRNAIPNDRVIRANYLTFLLSTDRLDAAIAVANLNLPGAQRFELAFLLPYINALISRDRIETAIATWNKLADRKLILYHGPDPKAGIFLTNGALAGAPMNTGFDWRTEFADPIRFTYLQSEPCFRFDFDSGVPDSASVMAQAIPVIGGKGYRFYARYRSDVDPEKSGLGWSFFDRKNGKAIPGRASVSDGEPANLTIDLDVPPETDSVELRLAYQRQPGTLSIRGFYELLHADLKLR